MKTMFSKHVGKADVSKKVHTYLTNKSKHRNIYYYDCAGHCYKPDVINTGASFEGDYCTA